MTGEKMKREQLRVEISAEGSVSVNGILLPPIEEITEWFRNDIGVCGFRMRVADGTALAVIETLKRCGEPQVTTEFLDQHAILTVLFSDSGQLSAVRASEAGA